MAILKEFKEFAVKGNMIDMAVGIIVGASFSKLVSSLVGDVIMPPIGLLLGGVDFTDLNFVLKAAAGETAAVVLSYGKFIQTIVDFIIITLSVFFVIKFINQLKRKKEKAPAKPSAETVLLTEIRDLLKQK